MRFERGDWVHLAGMGTGIVREIRSGNRYAVEIKGRLVVAAGDHLEVADGKRRARSVAPGGEPHDSAAHQVSALSPSLDLHGKTTAESVEMVELFVDAALRAGHHEVRIIHGKGSGRVKSAVHRYLRTIATIDLIRLDPRNSGVTIVVFR